MDIDKDIGIYSQIFDFEEKECTCDIKSKENCQKCYDEWLYQNEDCGSDEEVGAYHSEVAEHQGYYDVKGSFHYYTDKDFE